jgi:hypothetical protein
MEIGYKRRDKNGPCEEVTGGDRGKCDSKTYQIGLLFEGADGEREREREREIDR